MNHHSEQINEIAAALSKAQGHMKAAVKDSSNPHFKSKYADLASVWDACRESLSNNNLAIMQMVSIEGDKQVLITMLTHSSGQWMKSYMPLPIQKPGPQELGSCLSYCRRYGLASMVGVYQDDDDGERAEYQVRRLSPMQMEMLNQYLSQDKEAVDILSARFKCNWQMIPQDKFSDVHAWLKGRKEKEEIKKNEEPKHE